MPRKALQGLDSHFQRWGYSRLISVIDFCNLILLYYTVAKAKARVTGMRETFLPWARSDPRLRIFKR